MYPLEIYYTESRSRSLEKGTYLGFLCQEVCDTSQLRVQVISPDVRVKALLNLIAGSDYPKSSMKPGTTSA